MKSGGNACKLRPYTKNGKMDWKRKLRRYACARNADLGAQMQAHSTIAELHSFYSLQAESDSRFTRLLEEMVLNALLRKEGRKEEY